jgi:hypothetical protein
MNNFQGIQRPLDSSAPVGEILLAGVAVRIELPPSLHKLAVERYEAIRKHIERPDSALHDKVLWFYPQGSMAIRATIKSKRQADGYDIDIVAELDLPHSLTPAQTLDLLYLSIKGEKGSLYYDMVERQTRCVTVYYADGMHLDVTPSKLLDKNDPRRSYIFHAKPTEPPSAHKRVVMNSWAFCDHFNRVLPPDLLFAQAYAKKAQDFESNSIRADADVKPVPAHSIVDGGKSSAVVALQLLKRNRNIRYSKREGLRLPPSVMLAKFASECQLPTGSIAGALDVISSAILAALEGAEAKGQLIDVRNPKCQSDCFTDRWPENRTTQHTFVGDLRLFRRQLSELMNGSLDLAEMQELLIGMFGEGPAKSVIEERAKTLGRAVQTGQRTITGLGKVLPVAAVAAPAAATTIATPRPHTFFGERWKKK